LYYLDMNLPSEKITLDAVDRKIIAALRADGRVALAKIAEELGVSPGMIRMRYNRLIESGCIKIVAISNPLRMGYNTMALIGIRAEGQKLLEIAEKIAALEEVIYLIVTSGSYDIMAEVICRDHAHLLQFLTERLYQIDGVRESETFMHLKIVKEVYF
jgi:Lrp/AsnC family transcriptional regulator for asnA, asnC and gidA